MSGQTLAILLSSVFTNCENIEEEVRVKRVKMYPMDISLAQNIESLKWDSLNNVVIIGASYAKGWKLGKIRGINFINKGENGQQSFEMLARFDKDVIALDPDAVIIWGFINDIFRSERQNLDNALEKTKKSFEKMVELSRQNDIIPIILTEVTVREQDRIWDSLKHLIGGILGKESYQDYVNSHVIEINKWLINFCEDQHIAIIDIQPLLSNSDGWRKKAYAKKDGSHITEAGYKHLNDFLTEIIK